MTQPVLTRGGRSKASPRGRRGAAGERLAFLRATTLFRDFKESEVRELMSVFRRQRVRAGEHIFWEGELGESLYFILKGEARMSRRVNGEEELLATLGRGETFGETGLLRGGIRTASAFAKTGCQLLVLDKAEFDRLDDKLALRLMHNVALASMEKLAIANRLIALLHRRIRLRQARGSKEAGKGKPGR